jgi:hypothetical protein
MQEIQAKKSMADEDVRADRELVVRTLRELVQALDRRVAHVERLGEARIAGEAAALRSEALRRIQELTDQAGDPGPQALPQRNGSPAGAEVRPASTGGTQVP